MKCKMCGRPFEKYAELGPERLPVYIHDYPTLETCKAIRFPIDFMNRILQRHEAVKKKLQEKPK